MHPNASFRWPGDDAEARAGMEALIASTGFAMIFVATPGGPRVVHVPVVSTGDGAVQFHIARANAAADHLDGARALCVVNGPDAYISPDWYDAANIDAEVPTWNYVAVELEGRVRTMEREGLIGNLNDIAAREEAKLAPKPLWGLEKLDTAKRDRLLDAIVGFELEIDEWRATFKMGQNKPAPQLRAAADALEAAGRPAVAHLMRSVASSKRSES